MAEDSATTTQTAQVRENDCRLCLGGRFSPSELLAAQGGLKKRKPKKKDAKKKATQFAKQLCETPDDYYALVKDSYFEVYYERIKDFTFASCYVPLSRDDLAILLQLHKQYKAAVQPSDETQEPAAEAKEASKEDLTHIAQAIDEKMAEHQWRQSFVRMSIRSPKDSATSSTKFRPIFERELERLYEEHGREPPESLNCTEREWTTNAKIIACYRASTLALTVDNGMEAIGLLERSDRIQGDMESLLNGEYDDESHQFEQFQLVLREFKFFDVQLEFRAFVYERNLTGLTQYNDLCYFPDVVTLRDQILEKIQRFLDRLLDAIEQQSFVLDIVLCDEGYDGESPVPSLTAERLANDDLIRVYVVEINPMAEFAGGGLFHWESDKDVLLGSSPFEFRVNTKMPKFADANLIEMWEPFLKEHVGNRTVL